MRAQIVMATYNPAPDLLARQITSLQAQTVEDWDCLVLDDGSSEGGAAVAAALREDDRFHLVPQTRNRGPYLAFEALLRRVSGEIPVFLCDQDDVWREDKLELLLSMPGTAFCAMRVVDESGGLVRQRFLQHPPTPRDLTPTGLLLMNRVSGAALKVSPEVLPYALPFPAAHLRGWHDQWLAAVAARLGELCYLDEPLVDYTKHTGQVAGDGLRQITRQRLKGFLRTPNLRSRSAWVRAAAARLLEIPGEPDADLEALATDRVGHVIARYDVPWRRALLLRTGAAIGTG